MAHPTHYDDNTFALDATCAVSGSSSPRLRVEPEDEFLRDATNRACLLRGVNLSGSCKFPKYPVPVPSHVGGDAFLKQRGVAATTAGAVNSRLEHQTDANRHHHENGHYPTPAMSLTLDQQKSSSGQSPIRTSDKLSFVGRPFELEEADEHLARLRHWGFRMIRWVVTWEAIEHQGPGVYDQEFLDYTVQALLKAKEHGFRVMIDFHQDVWSRFTGGSGAPLWTLYAAGLDPHHFAATGAASVHNTLTQGEPLLRMVWLTNYYKLACASMFTLFYAGKILAPQCTFNQGVNIQDYLQTHFLGAIHALVEKIHQCKDAEGKNMLEDDAVIGYDSWNEPSCGWIGLERLDTLPEQHDMRQGDMPTPLQSLILGEGLAVHDVATYQLELVGPVKSGTRAIDPLSKHADSHRQPVKAWLDSQSRDRYDLQFGILRDTTFPRAGECLWAQLGVWSIKDRKVLQQDFFAKGPLRKQEVPSSRRRIEWVPDHWLPFARRVIEVVREVHPTAILFLEPPVYVPPPDLLNGTLSVDSGKNASNKVLLNNMVYAPHHYDDLVLLTKRYLGWINIDLLGLSRGLHRNLLGSIVLGKRATESLFGSQIGNIQEECHQRLGRRPVLIGETGLHFDVGLAKAHQAGNASSECDGDKKKPTTWWPFLSVGSRSKSGPSTHNIKSNAVSQQFRQAFDNILDGLDRTLVNYTLWNYTIENDAQYGDGWNGENLSLYCADTQALASENEEDNDKTIHTLNRGGRAIEQFCRPYPVATVGSPTEIIFDRHRGTFKLWTSTKDLAVTSSIHLGTAAPIGTEIYIPRYHFLGPDHCDVKASDGSWEWDVAEQILLWVYGENDKSHTNRQADGDHWIEVRRRQ